MKTVLNKKLLPITLACFAISSVFFSDKLIPFFTVTIIILLFFETKIKLNFLYNSKFLTPYIFYICVYLFYIFFSDDLTQALKILERQVLVIVLPIVVFASNLNKKRSEVFMKTYLLLMLLATVISIYLLFNFLNSHEEWINFMNKKSGNYTYLQFKYPHLMDVHPTYWAYLLVITNILLLNNKVLKVFKNQLFVNFLLIVFNVNLFYLSARTPLIINLIIHAIFFINFFRFNKKERKKLILYALIFLSILVVFLFQPLMVFKLSNITNDDRFYLWPKAIEVIKNNYFILGEGLGVGNKILKEHIFDIYDTRNNYYGEDLHNQYLKAYLDLGLLGLLSLLNIIFYPLLMSFKYNKNVTLNLSFSILFFLCLMTESVLYTIKGITVFILLSTVLIKIITHNKENN